MLGRILDRHLIVNKVIAEWIIDCRREKYMVFQVIVMQVIDYDRPIDKDQTEKETVDQTSLIVGEIMSQLC